MRGRNLQRPRRLLAAGPAGRNTSSRRRPLALPEKRDAAKPITTSSGDAKGSSSSLSIEEPPTAETVAFGKVAARNLQAAAERVTAAANEAFSLAKTNGRRVADLADAKACRMEELASAATTTERTNSLASISALERHLEAMKQGISLLSEAPAADIPAPATPPHTQRIAVPVGFSPSSRSTARSNPTSPSSSFATPSCHIDALTAMKRCYTSPEYQSFMPALNRPGAIRYLGHLDRY